MLNTEIISKKIQEKINVQIPHEVLKDRDGDDGKKLYYIRGVTAIDILNYYSARTFHKFVKVIDF